MQAHYGIHRTPSMRNFAARIHFAEPGLLSARLGCPQIRALKVSELLPFPLRRVRSSEAESPGPHV